MTHYELWEAHHLEQMMDAPFPPAMMPDIEKFFREVHPKLTPGKDIYPEVFATDLFFPLQRPKELAAMMQLARKAGPKCQDCLPDAGCGLAGRLSELCCTCHGLGTKGPVTVMEVGADKGGGLYHWCMCLPTVRNVIACEIRGTPYKHEFEKAFPRLRFLWLPRGSQDVFVLEDMKQFAEEESLIDVLFIDGDKLGMLKDFEAYLPLMRRPGGLVFMHDITDDHPKRQFDAIVKRNYLTGTIVYRSEGEELSRLVALGYEPKTPHEGWLAHWAGRSCGVGVVHL